MHQVLMINCSPHGSQSACYQLATEMIQALRHGHPEIQVVERDLVADPLLPVGPAYAHGILDGHADDDPAFEQSERLIVELERCDLLLIATPIHNFTLPAALKLWIDNVVRIRRTCDSGPRGKVGLLADRPVYILVSSGGSHRGPAARQPEFLTSYLRHVLDSVGLCDVHFVYLQGTIRGRDAVSAELEAARRQLAFEPLFTQLQHAEAAGSGSRRADFNLNQPSHLTPNA
ncbi:NAD(P)H-dependent oxidoreductase [Pseudomonas putida]|uniref:FMN-dependent NADH-azoreductase n=1 Tax=Pseudomonas putida TaxID=303 RepID=UPI002364A6AC|nr:NAD(P)H-dependent oxidoreductase [Pseudomonas putida]MDD1969061.1 NAD(P)H-dependent oxidoreductase [Pseudomonas putida]